MPRAIARATRIRVEYGRGGGVVITRKVAPLVEVALCCNCFNLLTPTGRHHGGVVGTNESYGEEIKAHEHPDPCSTCRSPMPTAP